MIEIENISKKFGNLLAVDNLTLKVPAGELFCFLGPNGAGKTTTIKLACGLLKPSAGKILIGGFDIVKEPDKVRKIIGYIPDMPFLYDRLTPAEFYEFIGDLYKVPRSEMNKQKSESFDLFDLHQYANCMIKDLSHGYRQRLIYAATFLHHPRVLFVDEPFIGLDPFTIRLIHTLLRQKVAEGMTIFMTSHILALIEKLADRIGIINGGRLVAVGSLEELKTQSLTAGKNITTGSEIESWQLEDVFFHLTGRDRC